MYPLIITFTVNGNSIQKFVADKLFSGFIKIAPGTIYFALEVLAPDLYLSISEIHFITSVQEIVLVMGTMVITNSRSGSELLIAVLFVGYQVFCAFLANFKYKLACSLVAIPNLLIAALEI